MTGDGTWPQLDTIDLRLLTEVARTGSIRAAATSLRMTQPSASARLAALERRLGSALLNRSTRGARLTPAGTAVHARAVRVLDLLATAQRDARRLHGLTLLNLGAPASLAPGLATLLAHAQLSRTTLAWHSDHSSALIDAVLDTTLDAAFITGRDGPPELTIRHLWDETTSVTVRPEHPLAVKGRPLELADLDNHRVALHLWGHTAAQTRTALEAHPQLSVVSPATTAVALAEAADHVAITLTLATRAAVRAGRLVELDIHGLEPGSTEISLAYRTATSHALWTEQLAGIFKAKPTSSPASRVSSD